MTISPATRALLPYALLSGVGPVTQRTLAQRDVQQEAPEYVATQSKPVARALAAQQAWEAAEQKAEEQVALAQHYGARIVSLYDADYPHLLRQAEKGPAILYVRGSLPDPRRGAVAIIGTRSPTAHGTLIAERISRYCAGQGFAIVSGLALGCDTIAHRTALACGTPTLAVLAHGLQTMAPKENSDLAEAILENGGALVSEFPFGTPPTVARFVQRDKTQAALAQGVIMVQSGLDGGSLHACRAALTLKRWLAVPCPTSKDREAFAEKVAANTVIIEGTPGQVRDLLNCQPEDRARIIALRGREDYPLIRAHIFNQCENLSPGPDCLET